MSDRVVRATGSAEFLALVPRLVGFRPVESLVLVAFSGPRTGCALRVDLPRGDAARLDAVARHLIGLLCRVEGIDGLVPVVYTAAPFAAVPSTLLVRLAVHACAAGLTLREAFCVAGDGWGRLPRGPRRPLHELREDVAGLLDADRELRIPHVAEEARARFRAQLSAWRTHPDGPGGRLHGFAPGAGGGAGPFLARAAAGLDTTRLLEGMLEPHDGSCGCRSALAAFAAVPALRDHLLVHLAWGPDRGDDPFARDALAGGDVPRPSVARIEAALDAVRAAAAHLEPGDRAPLYTCAAWFEWALGRGSLAGAVTDRALAIDPDHPLARRLHDGLQRGILPDWAFHAAPVRTLEEQLRPPPRSPAPD